MAVTDQIFAKLRLTEQLSVTYLSNFVKIRQTVELLIAGQSDRRTDGRTYVVHT